MDHYHDTYHATLHTLYGEGILPEFIKSAAILEETEQVKLPDSAYADPVRRRYPIHSPEDTLVSAAYFFKTAEYTKFPHIADKLAQAAFAHEVEDHFLDIARKTVALEKTASANKSGAYALKLTHGKSVIGRYYMPDGQHVKCAHDHFVKNYRKYPLTWRKTVANEIVKRANDESLNFAIHPVVTAYSGDNVCYSEKAALGIAKRAYMVKDDVKIAQVLSKIASAIRGEMRTPETLEKVARVIDYIDRTSGLDRYYGSHFEDPYKTIFNMTKEAAEDVANIVDILGDQYTMAELANTDPDLFRRALGQDFVDEIKNDMGAVDAEKLKDILPTLPRDEKAILAKHLKASASSE